MPNLNPDVVKSAIEQYTEQNKALTTTIRNMDTANETLTARYNRLLEREHDYNCQITLKHLSIETGKFSMLPMSIEMNISFAPVHPDSPCVIRAERQNKKALPEILNTYTVEEKHDYLLKVIDSLSLEEIEIRKNIADLISKLNELKNKLTSLKASPIKPANNMNTIPESKPIVGKANPIGSFPFLGKKAKPEELKPLDDVSNVPRLKS